MNEPPRYVVLRTKDGRYVGRRGRRTILVREKSRAVVWDWIGDRVPESLDQVEQEFGERWIAEPANTDDLH